MSKTMTDQEQSFLNRIKGAVQEGARFETVRLLIGPVPWGVAVYEPGRTKGGNPKWTRITTILPNEGETVADVLVLLSTMVPTS